MAQTKHGKYDQERKLPDNHMQPSGSGSAVWFQERILATLGESAGQALIEESRQQGSQKTAWLCVRLREIGHEDLVEAYKERRRQDAATLRIRDKERIIARCQATLARNDTPPEHRAFLLNRIEKAQKYLDEHSAPERSRR